MLPNVGPEFVEAVLSLGTNKPAMHPSPAASQSGPAGKRLDRPASFGRSTLLALFHILTVLTSKWMVYLILMYLLCL